MEKQEQVSLVTILKTKICGDTKLTFYKGFNWNLMSSHPTDGLLFFLFDRLDFKMLHSEMKHQNKSDYILYYCFPNGLNYEELVDMYIEQWKLIPKQRPAPWQILAGVDKGRINLKQFEDDGRNS